MTLLRAPKDTPARNAARTLTAGVLVALLLLIGSDPALRYYDQLTASPLIDARVTLVANRERPDGLPDILFAVTASREVVGLHSSWVQARAGSLCRRLGAIQVAGHEVTRSTWSGWFGVECAPPAEAFQVCIRYVVATHRQAREVSSPFCSEPHAARQR